MKSLNVKVSLFASQRGLQLVSVPHNWTKTSSYGRLLSKIGTIRNGQWAHNKREITKSDFFVGSTKDIIHYLDMDPEASTLTRMWLLAGTVNHVVSVSNPKARGPSVYILGAIVAHQEKGVASIDSIAIFSKQLKPYLFKWSEAIRKQKPSKMIRQQMRREIIQVLIFKMIAHFYERRKSKYFANTTAIKLIFPNLGTKQRIRSKKMVSKIEDYMDEHSQEIVNKIVCSEEVDEPEYMAGGKVRLPTSSEYCQSGLNRRSYEGGHLFQSYMTHQLDEKKTRAPRKRRKKYYSDDDSSSSSSSSSDSDSDSDSDYPTTSPIYSDVDSKLYYSAEDEDSSSSSSSDESEDESEDENDSLIKKENAERNLLQQISEQVEDQIRKLFKRKRKLVKKEETL